MTSELEGGPQSRRAIGVGASAGGVDALMRLVRGLPLDLAAPMLVVLHIPASGRGLLASILERQTDLPVRTAEDGAPLVAGEILVAPPDRHMVVEDDRIVLERGPKENGVRPAVDPMLRSLASDFGPGAIAVVLSGALGDGSIGARAVAAAGGTVLVQAPDDATVPSMPESALRAVGTGAVTLTAGEMGGELGRLAASAPPPEREEVAVTGETDAPLELARPPGPPSALTCPECHGPLWQFEEVGAKGYRCRVGHGYSEEALVAAQGERVEAALWTALEVLEERAELLNRIADRHGDARPKSRTLMRTAARDALERADNIRQALAAGPRGASAFDVAAEEATA